MPTPVSCQSLGLLPIRKTLERTIHERYVAFEADHLVIDSLIEALNDPEKIGILFPAQSPICKCVERPDGAMLVAKS